MEFCRTPFLDTLAQLPASSVIFSEGQRQTFAGSLYRSSISLAVGLRRNGFRAKDRIGIIVPPGSDFLEIFFASTMLEGIVAIIDPEMGRDNFESKLRQFAPHWLFIDSRLLFLREHSFVRHVYLKCFKQAFYCDVGNEVGQIISTGMRLPLGGKFLHKNDLHAETTENITFIGLHQSYGTFQ